MSIYNPTKPIVRKRDKSTCNSILYYKLLIILEKISTTGKTMRHLFVLFTFLLSGLSQVSAEAIMTKAQETRVDLLKYLRVVEPMVRNYPGKTKDGKIAEFEASAGQEGDRVFKYGEIKRLFQEGIMLYYEGRYPNSYRRFLEAQVNLEHLLEELSQNYIENTDEILKASMEKKLNDSDYANIDDKKFDKDIVDISVEFGRGSYMHRQQGTDREAPLVGRTYEPREYHYRMFKDQIEGSVQVGYKLLGQAKDTKLKALKIERSLEKHQRLQPDHRKYRIERYIEVIARCREARLSAMHIFRLKYPYENEYLQKDDKVELEKVSNNYRLNPYTNISKPNPVFDKRIPVAYRRDAVDIDGRIFIDEVNNKIRLARTDVDSINRLLEKYGETQKLDKPAAAEPGKTGPAPADKNANTPATKPASKK
jgi:hypothetical protein